MTRDRLIFGSYSLFTIGRWLVIGVLYLIWCRDTKNTIFDTFTPSNGNDDIIKARCDTCLQYAKDNPDKWVQFRKCDENFDYDILENLLVEKGFWTFSQNRDTIGSLEVNAIIILTIICLIASCSLCVCAVGFTESEQAYGLYVIAFQLQISVLFGLVFCQLYSTLFYLHENDLGCYVNVVPKPLLVAIQVFWCIFLVSMFLSPSDDNYYKLCTALLGIIGGAVTFIVFLGWAYPKTNDWRLLFGGIMAVLSLIPVLDMAVLTALFMAAKVKGQMGNGLTQIVRRPPGIRELRTGSHTAL